MNTDLTPNDILQTASAFQRSRVLLTAYELGLFSVLSDRAVSANDVAVALKTDARATERLMNALCALELLQKRNGLFSNTPQAAAFLVAGKPGYLAGLMHTAHLWETWGTLTEAVRQGRSVVARPIDDRGETWLKAFIAAMHARARHQAPEMVALLDLSRVSRVLDVGGGSGIFSMAFVRARAGITATVFDLPNVVPLTRDYIAREGLQDRIDTVVGDYNADALGTGYDLVFLSAIVHSNDDAQNAALIQKCADALNPGGRVVVADFVMDDDRTRPASGTFFALNMLVGTTSGDTFTEPEVRAWMTAAGLSGVTRQDTAFGVGLVIGRKV